MTTPAQLLEHYDHNVRPALGRPRDFAVWYKNLSVLGTGDQPVNVSVHKYRMNTDDPDKLDEAGRIRDSVADGEIGSAKNSLQAWVRRLERSSTHQFALGRLRSLKMAWSRGGALRRFRRVFNGKGAPRDIALALGLLDVSGRLASLFPGVSSSIAMQSYCDRFIGVDCSGFVNGYFTALGRRTDDLTDRPTIAMHAGAGRRLAAMPGAPRNHVFCWVNGASRTSFAPGRTIRFGHIIAVDDWINPPNAATNDPVGATFRCTQSSASLGGINTQTYEILRAPSPGARANTWRIQRIIGLGDNVLEPAKSVWNDVFLAPPM